ADLAEARARRFLEGDAGQAEVAQFVLDQRARRARQVAMVRIVRDRGDRGVQLAVLAEFARVFDDLLLRGRIRLAQRFRIGDAVQVRDRRPYAVQALGQLLAGQD